MTLIERIKAAQREVKTWPKWLRKAVKVEGKPWN